MGGSIGALSENCRADTKTALNWWQSVRPSGFRPRNESEDIRDGTERLSMADESDKRVIVGRRGRQVNSVQLDAVNWAEHPEDVEDGNHLGGVWGEGGGTTKGGKDGTKGCRRPLPLLAMYAQGKIKKY
jgi:hypothetical protein